MLHKQELATAPFNPVPKFTFKELQEKSYKHTYIVTASLANLQKSGMVLVVDVFDIHGMHCFRFFSDKHKHLCAKWTERQELEWNTRNPSNWFTNKERFISTENSTLLAGCFLWPDRQNEYCSVMDCIVMFARCQATRRKREYEQRRYELMRKHYRMVKNLPESVIRHANRHFMSNYQIVEKQGPKQLTASCSACGYSYPVKKVNHRKAAKCPHCKHEGIFFNARFLPGRHELCPVCVPTFVDKQVILRWVNIERWYDKTGTPQFTVYEKFHALYLRHKGGIKRYAYAHRLAYWIGDWFRCKNDEIYLRDSYLYPRGLAKAIEMLGFPKAIGNHLQHCKTPVALDRLLKNLRIYPAIENLIYNGLYRLAGCSPYTFESLDTRDFEKCLGISNHYRQMYRRLNPSWLEHDLIRNSKTWISEDEILRGRKLGLFDLNWGEREIDDMLAKMSFKRLLHYLERQKALHNYRISQLTLWYRDYLNMANHFGHNLGDKRVLLPKDVREAHHRLAAERTEEEQRVNAMSALEKLEHRKERAKVIDHKMDSIKRNLYPHIGEFGDVDYVIRMPESWYDFAFETYHLKHCVGQFEFYFNRHCEGKSLICFVRRKHEPDKPYYTLEVDMTRLKKLQLQGYGHMSASKELNAFAEKFIRHLAKAVKQSFSAPAQDAC